MVRIFFCFFYVCHTPGVAPESIQQIPPNFRIQFAVYRNALGAANVHDSASPCSMYSSESILSPGLAESPARSHKQSLPMLIFQKDQLKKEINSLNFNIF